MGTLYLQTQEGERLMDKNEDSNTYNRDFKQLIDKLYMEAIFDALENRTYQIIDGKKYKVKL